MGAGSGYDDGITASPPHGDEDGAAAGKGPAPRLPAPAAASLPPRDGPERQPASDAAVTALRARRLWVLRNKYPCWHVWADDAGWHAFRRGSFRHGFGPDAAVHSLHCPDSRLLGVHLAIEDEWPVPEGDWQP